MAVCNSYGIATGDLNTDGKGDIERSKAIEAEPGYENIACLCIF